jgi:hypothetical protein
MTAYPERTLPRAVLCTCSLLHGEPTDYAPLNRILFTLYELLSLVTVAFGKFFIG